MNCALQREPHTPVRTAHCSANVISEKQAEIAEQFKLASVEVLKEERMLGGDYDWCSVTTAVTF